MVGAKERRNHSMQSTFSASLGKSHARKFIFGGVLVAALTAAGLTQVPSTPVANSAIVSTNTKDIGNLKKEKQQQIEYFLVNDGLKKVNILFLTTVDDIGRWKEALGRYFAEKSSHTVNITVSSPKGGEEGLNGEKLLYYNVVMEKVAKNATENAVMPNTAPATSNPVAVLPVPVPVQPQVKPEIKPEAAKTEEKKREVKAEIGSMAGIKPEVKVEMKTEIKAEPIIKETKKEEPKIAGAEEKKEPIASAPISIPIPKGMQRIYVGQSIVENKCAIDLKTLSVPYGDVSAKASLVILDGISEQEATLEIAGNETKKTMVGSNTVTVISSNLVAGLTPLDSYADLKIIVEETRAEETKPIVIPAVIPEMKVVERSPQYDSLYNVYCSTFDKIHLEENDETTGTIVTMLDAGLNNPASFKDPENVRLIVDMIRSRENSWKNDGWDGKWSTVKLRTLMLDLEYKVFNGVSQ